MKLIATLLEVEKTEECEEYPKLMKYSDSDDVFIVLFSAPQRGVIVYYEMGDSFVIGHFSKTWNMQAFKPFQGTIQLTSV